MSRCVYRNIVPKHIGSFSFYKIFNGYKKYFNPQMKQIFT